MQAATIKRSKLPLWLLVLFVSALVLLISYVVIYFYHQQEMNGVLHTQQSSLVEQKENLLAQDDVINTNWLRTLNNKVKNVQGGIIWSTKKQQGIIYLQNLPKTIKQQYYRLWVYDLATQANKRVSAALFQHKGNKDNEYLIAISPDVPVKHPYKFELVLLESIKEKNATDGQRVEHPLLLAQP